MSTHCCDPAHRDFDEWRRRMRNRVNEAEARATWAETNEAVMAEHVGKLYDEIDRLKAKLGQERS